MISHPRSGGPSRNDEPDKPGAYEPADNPPVVQTASSVSKDPPTQPLLAQAPDPSTLEVFVELTNGLRATPLHVPQRLLEAFRALKVDPVLSGGAALQIWTGRFDDIFMTPDLDMVSHLQVRELIEHGINIEKSGRHAIVDGVAVELPQRIGPHIAQSHGQSDPTELVRSIHATWMKSTCWRGGSVMAAISIMAII